MKQVLEELGIKVSRNSATVTWSKAMEVAERFGNSLPGGELLSAMPVNLKIHPEVDGQQTLTFQVRYTKPVDGWTMRTKDSILDLTVNTDDNDGPICKINDPAHLAARIVHERFTDNEGNRVLLWT